MTAGVRAADGLTRALLARAVLDWTARSGRPLVVGNGFLSREVMAEGDGDHVLYLLAGMGLAPAVAAGIARASGMPVAALEGDGNHLMGLSGSATIGLSGIPLTHVVHWNGGWESTGGQQFLQPGTAHDIGRAFGYARSTVVRDAAGLRAALAVADGTSGPCLIHAVGSMNEPAAPRAALSMPDNAHRFRRWASAYLPMRGAGARLL